MNPLTGNELREGAPVLLIWMASGQFSMFDVQRCMAANLISTLF
jgi:hypothetical protein